MRRTHASITFLEVRRTERGHAFYPSAAALAAIPPLYATDGMGDAKLIHVRYFCNWGEWYIAELDPATGRAFGWAMLHGDVRFGEWGYCDLPALESQAPSRLGDLVERDLNFTPAPAWDCLPAGRSYMALRRVRTADGREWRPLHDTGLYRADDGTELPIARLHTEAGPVRPL